MLEDGLAKSFLKATHLLEGSYCDGAAEDSTLLHAFLNSDPALKHQLDKLKRELKQDAILVVKSSEDLEVV